MVGLFPLERESLLACTVCDFLVEKRADLGGTPVLGDGNHGATILLVADNVSDDESTTGSIVSDLGDWPTVLGALKAAGVPLAAVSKLYATRCPAGLQDRKKISKKHLTTCREWLDSEVALYPRAKVVVALGNLASAGVLGIAKGRVPAARKQRQTVHLGGKELQVVMTVHPYQASQEPLEWESLIADLRRAINFSRGNNVPFSIESVQESHADSYQFVDSIDAMTAMVDWLLAAELVAFDCETRKADPWHLPTSADAPFLTCLQFSPGPDEAFFVPWVHEDFDVREYPEMHLAWWEDLARFFAEYQGCLTAHNGKFDQVAIAQEFGVYPRLGFDTMLGDQLLRGMPARTLKALAWEVSPFGGYEAAMNSVKVAPENDWDSYWYPIDVLYWYGCLDADVTWRAADYLRKELAEFPDRVKLSAFLAEASGALAKIEVSGWRMDVDYLEGYGRALEADMEAAEELARQIALVPITLYERHLKKSFNFHSSGALGVLLYELMRIECPEMTKGGKPSVAKSALKKIDQKEHPVVKALLDFKKVAKSHSMFYKKWRDGRAGNWIHFSYNLGKFRDLDTGEGAGTISGRLSSSGPAGNIQQVPKPKKDPRIRGCFLPDDDDSVLFDIDFSTLEYVIAAIYSKDPKLVEAFKKGWDVHAAVAAEMFKSTPEEMMRPENELLRNKGKTMNFSTIFGAGPKNVAEQLQCSEDEAVEFLATYKKRFPVLFEWIEIAKDFARENGYTLSRFGRIRRLPDAQLPPTTWRNKGKIDAALRIAVNTPIQADASDICLLGLVRIIRWIDEKGLRTRVKATIHDAIVLSVPLDELEVVYETVIDILTHPAIDWIDGESGLGVPLRVRVDAGPNWGAMETIG